MITPIPFEPRRFRSAAVHYLAGRPDYAAGLAPRVAMLCGLDGSGQALDLGCGPGQLARAFVPFVAGAVGLDPEPEMLAVGRALSTGLPIRFEQGSSNDLAAGMGPFRIVLIGRAFHWMDRVETLRRLDGLIAPGGAVVLFRTDHLDVPANAWQAKYQAVLDGAVAGGNRAAWKQPGWVKHEAVLLDSPFAALERIGVVTTLRTPVETLAERAMSMSSTTRARLGEDAVARLRQEIAAVLTPEAVGGLVTEVVESVALIARRT
jgi:trans-aconitate methyltransferase